MARAIGSAKRSAAALAADTLTREDDPPLEIALDLAPLIAPYRRHTRMTIRVERLPHRGRLTRGRNNGDRSYSLMPDELEGLTYLPPAGMTEPHTLTVRLINLEGGEGATLAVHDYPIEGEVAEPVAAEKPAAATKPSSEARNAVELRRLRDEMGRLQTELAARDEELEVARAEFELAEQSRQRVEAELSAARAGREKDLREKLAAVQADAARRLDDERRSWESEHQADAASSGQAIQSALEHARTEWRREAEAALAKAQSAWKAEEAARTSVAEARLQKESAAAIAEAKARAERAEAELARTKVAAGSTARGAIEAEVAKAQAAWKVEEAARLAALEARFKQQSAAVAAEAKARVARAETELAKAKVTAGSAARSAIDAEVAKAQAAWKADEAARLADAESRWREESAKVSADAAKRSERAEADAAKLREQLAAAHATVTASEAKLAGAEAAWKAREEARLSAAEASFQQKSAKPLAEMKARSELAEIERDKLRSDLEKLRNQSSDVESRRLSEGAELTALRVDLATAQSALAKRDAELLDARGAADRAWSALEDSREIWKREADTAVAEAEARWKAGEAARLSAAEAQWREDAAKHFSDAEARAANLEGELAQARAEIQTTHAAGDAEADRSDGTVTTLRQTLAERDAELVQLRAAAEKATPASDKDLAAAQAKIAELEKTVAEWKDNEASRLSAAETRGHNHSVKALAEAQGKQKQAEKALAHLQSQVEKLRQRTDDAELFRLRDQVAALEAAIAERDLELVQARAEANQARDRWARESQLKQEKHELAEEERRHKQSSKMVRDIAIVAVLIMALIVFYPRVEALVVGGVVPNLEAMANGRQVSLSDFTTVPANTPASKAAAPKTAAAAPRPTAVSIRAANVRSDPSTSASVIAKLPRGVEVSIKERHGSWVHVAIAAGGKTQDGWVYGTFLQDNPTPSSQK